MYEIARVVHENGGEVIGVIPRGMVERELAYSDLPDLRIVASMHERKAMMAGLADGFIALPGGFLNTAGYFDKLLEFLNHAAAERFIQAEHRAMVLVEKEPASLLEKFDAYVPPDADMARWALDLTNG